MRNADRIKEAMSSQPTTLLSPTEYLEQDRQAQRKSEYFQGQMFGMAGASPQHVLIVTNLVRELSQKLKGRPCRVYSSDLRLRVAPTGLYTYPDVMVVCGAVCRRPKGHRYESRSDNRGALGIDSGL